MGGHPRDRGSARTAAAARKKVSCAAVALALVVWALAAPAAAYPRPGKTAILSVTADGTQADGVPNANGAAHSSEWPTLTPDGRYVAFHSHATNLVPGDTNARADVFLKDTVTGAIERVTSAPTLGGFVSDSWAPRLTPDARYVVVESWNSFHADDVGWADVYLFDRQNGTFEWISRPFDGTAQQESAFHPAISDDGRFIAFDSEADNIAPGDTFSGNDVFVHDRLTGDTEIVSLTTAGAQSSAGGSGYAAMTGDARYVAFVSTAPLVSADTNGTYDVYRRDRVTGKTILISVATAGTCGNDGSYGPRISADGSVVTFSSAATNLVPQKTNGGSLDVYVRDVAGGTTTRVSVATSGRESNGYSALTAASPDGRYAVFWSDATNLVPGDVNGDRDVFLHDRVTGATELVSQATSSGGGNDMSWGISSITADASRVAFMSEASNIVPGDANDAQDVFLRERGPRTGVGGFDVSSATGAIHVDGWASFAGATIASASDPATDSTRSASLGGELTGISALYRVEQEDVFFRVAASSLATAVPTCPIGGCIGGVLPATVRYGVSFTIDGVRYEARAARVDDGTSPGEGTFTLYRCAPLCAVSGSITGGIGTTGNEVLFSIPATTIGATANTVLASVRATAGLGSGASWTEVWDTVEAGDAVVPPVSVSAAFTPLSTPLEDVSGWVPATLSDGSFTADLDPGSLPPEEGRVWVKACVGSTCGTLARPQPGG